MPTITNKTILKHAAPIAAKLQSRGDNWNADAGAAVIIKTVLEEMGCMDELTEEFKEERAKLILLVKPFLTASKNFQNSYLATTNDDDGKPLMQKITATAAAANDEFA